MYFTIKTFKREQQIKVVNFNKNIYKDSLWQKTKISNLIV